MQDFKNTYEWCNNFSVHKQVAEGWAFELLLLGGGMSVLHNMQIYMYSFPFDPIQRSKTERSFVLLEFIFFLPFALPSTLGYSV